MCGIVGWVGPGKFDSEKFEAGLKTLSRRGPDLQAMKKMDGAILGHTRLAILDLSPAGNQPMTVGELTLVYNGEIFNYPQIAEEIRRIRPEIQFQSTGDAEVLLRAYETWGAKCVEKFNGFFAFAIYNQTTQELFAARDPHGIKPFWYVHDERGFFFASEAKALFAAGYRFDLNPVSVYHFFQLNYVPPDTSIWNGVYKLLPGYSLTLEKNTLKLAPYPPTLPYPELPHPHATTYPQIQENVKALVENAVKIRLISDVPLGVFLSGGIDSSIVGAMAAKHQPELLTFSIGFDDPLFDETYYAELVAKHIGSRHTTFKLSFEDLAQSVNGLLDYLDEPFADSSAINTYILSERVSKHVKVALSGDGADELFGGYMKHVGEANVREKSMLNLFIRGLYPLIKHIPSHRNSVMARKIWQIKKYAEGMLLSPQERYWRWASVQDDDFLRSMIKTIPHKELLNKARSVYLERIDKYNDMNGVLSADMYLVLTGDMLTKVDMTSMAHSLEVRPPFLDIHLTDYVEKLPAEMKIKGSDRKRVLRDAFRKYLPEELYTRPKQGFEVPLRKLFIGPLKNYIEKEIVNREKIESSGLFRYPPIERLWNSVKSGGNTKEDWTLWALIVFIHCTNKYD